MNYFLNLPSPNGNKRHPAGSDGAFVHVGNGPNLVYVDPAYDLVVVSRWIPNGAFNDVLELVIGAIEER